MPVCICPQCSKSHKIPAKNLGLKGRCTECKHVFLLVEDAPAAVEPPCIAQPAPADEIASMSWPDAFSIPAVAPPPAPEPEASEGDSEFDWEESPDGTTEEASNIPTHRVAFVAKLENRPALIAISNVFRILGILCFVGALLVFGACLFSLAMTKMNAWIGVVILFTPSVLGCIFSGVMMFAARELIQMARSVEERLHEISKNVSR